MRNSDMSARFRRKVLIAFWIECALPCPFYRKSPGTGAMLCFIGHALMENRNGLIVQGDLTQADGHAERKAALDMIHRHSPGSPQQLTPRADKSHDAGGFVADLRQACVTPHIARKIRYSAIDGRTTRHAGYALSGSTERRWKRRPITVHPDNGRQQPRQTAPAARRMKEKRPPGHISNHRKASLPGETTLKQKQRSSLATNSAPC